MNKIGLVYKFEDRKPYYYIKKHHLPYFFVYDNPLVERNFDRISKFQIMMMGEMIFNKEFFIEELQKDKEVKESKKNDEDELFGYNIAIEYSEKGKKSLYIH